MEMPVGDVQGRCQTSFVKLATGDGYCCYTIKFTGCFENATKTVVADLTFHYANNCDITIRRFCPALIQTMGLSRIIKSYTIDLHPYK